MQAPSDAARPNHARVVLERSGEVLCIPQRAFAKGYFDVKPFREAEKRKRASQKESTKKKARRTSLLQNRGSSRA